MNISETLNYIHSVKWQGSKPGLSRTRELLRSLGNPEKRLKFIHIAGTNGKGSTCVLIASVLQEAGYKTGLYTSPYIMRFNERIQVDGRQITDGELIRLTEKIKPFAEAMEDVPTEFEMITALAMEHFLRKNCDIVVLETGMGGELDSTNVIDVPELAVITAIDYDHVAQLGPTLADIARAKAGIIKSGGDVLIYGGNREVEGVFENVASMQGATLHKVDFARIMKTDFSQESRADISPAGTRLTIEPYGETLLSLQGAYQPYNALTAISALEMLGEKGYEISSQDIISGIAKARWMGRFEFLGHKPAFILDGAHNPHGVSAAVNSLRAYYGEQKIIFIMGVLADKDVAAMTSKIAPAAEHVFTVSFDNPRAMDALTLADMFARHGVDATACGSVHEGVWRALEMAGECDVICALGSLFMSAEVRAAYMSEGRFS